MFGRKSRFERALDAQLGKEVGQAVARELGRGITSLPALNRAPDEFAYGVKMISDDLGPSASAHDIAAQFAADLGRAVGLKGHSPE